MIIRKIIRLFEPHPNGRRWRILRHFGYWYCQDCKTLHSKKVTMYYVRDNDTVC